MLKNTRKYQFFCAFTFALSAANAIANEKYPTNNDEQHAITYMADHNIRDFLLMDKKNGNMSIVRNGEIINRLPALHGRKKGDDFSKVRDVTQAGVFLYAITPDQKANDAAILFAPGDQYGQGYSLVIHRATPNRDRLLSSKPPATSKRTTSGCIVLKNAPDGYDLVSEFAQSIPPQTLTNGDGTPYSTGKYLVVLPDSIPINQVLPILSPAK